MTTAIRTKTERDKLLPRREPYWHALEQGKGAHVGYRIFRQDVGAWSARWRDRDGKRHFCALPLASDFASAVKAAKAWIEQISLRGDVKIEPTVGLACERYLDDLHVRNGEKSAKDARGRFNRLVFGQRIEKIKLHELTKAHVTAWRDAQVKGIAPNDDAGRKARDSANRNLSTLKAALNRAFADDLTVSDRAWSKVASFKDAGSRRPTYLSDVQREALLAHCDAELRAFITGLLLTGFRPGELANATVADFDKANGTVELKGKTGKRTATLSTKATAFFVQVSTGRIGRSPIFARPDGQAWGKDYWKKPFKAAAQAAQLPLDTVAYSLRHAAISDQIKAGIDSLVVARNAGTSVAMIEKHYGHFKHDQVRGLLDRAQRT